MANNDNTTPAENSQEDQSVAPENLAVTNDGVDLTATDTGVNPQAKKAKKANPDLTVADEAVLAADPTPVQEATAAGSNVEPVTGNPTPAQTNPVGMQIDASGLNVQTNQDVIDNFPKNDNGQVVYGEDGRIAGLDVGEQPAPANAANADQAEPADDKA